MSSTTAGRGGRSLPAPRRAALPPQLQAAVAYLLSSAGLIYLSLLVPDYIRPDWATLFALSGVPCVALSLVMLLRRRVAAATLGAVVLLGDAAIVMSAFASVDRAATPAAALLGLPTLFTATFAPARWLPAQVAVAAAGAWVITSLAEPTPAVHVIRTVVMVTAFLCPAVIVLLLRRQLDRAVLTDPLTDLLNRRGLEAQAPAQLARARRSGEQVAVLLADLDHFKRVNDSAGHETGDEVLRVVARTLGACARRSDLVVRHGGEELVLVLVAPESYVCAVAERVRSEVERAAAPWGVTVSIGTAWARPVDDDPRLVARLLAEADRRMYEAKRQGRNRVVLPTP